MLEIISFLILKIELRKDKIIIEPDFKIFSVLTLKKAQILNLLHDKVRKDKQNYHETSKVPKCFIIKTDFVRIFDCDPKNKFRSFTIQSLRPLKSQSLT